MLYVILIYIQPTISHKLAAKRWTTFKIGNINLNNFLKEILIWYITKYKWRQYTVIFTKKLIQLILSFLEGLRVLREIMNFFVFGTKFIYIPNLWLLGVLWETGRGTERRWNKRSNEYVSWDRVSNIPGRESREISTVSQNKIY